MQGLGNVAKDGDKPFTFDMAGDINASIVNSVQEQQQAFMLKDKRDTAMKGLGTLDRGAVKAVEQGIVSPQVVLSDSRVSGKAKSILQESYL